MYRLARPWDNVFLGEERPFGPAHCLLSEAVGAVDPRIDHSVLMKAEREGRRVSLLLQPYPPRDRAGNPLRAGFPVRLAPGQEPRPDHPEDVFGRAALARMTEVVARMQELEEALDDPARLWPRLRDAWDRAADEADPRMAEIVRQARQMRPVLAELATRIRRVLRRSRERTPLDRVKEMDCAAMLWLARQPGRSVAERAGSDQRILATVRRENFDTLENRVAHAYAHLAAGAAREWLLEHHRAQGGARFREVEAFRVACRTFARHLADLGVGIAEPGFTPNYVLMQDPGYRAVHRAWLRLLARRKVEDDLWAWQAELWTDFAVLAIVLALDVLDEAELIAQSPIVWRGEAVQGRWFEQDRPLAVFWLRETNRVVEVQARPESPPDALFRARAHVALRIADPARRDRPRRVAVWTPHAMQRLDLPEAARSARTELCADVGDA